MVSANHHSFEHIYVTLRTVFVHPSKHGFAFLLEWILDKIFQGIFLNEVIEQRVDLVNT